jgi:uncharacterized protein involved in outer membrane biogenesis
MTRWLRLALVAVMAFVMLFAASVWLLLAAPFLGDYRREIAQSALSKILDREVILAGKLTFEPGATVRVRFSELVIANAAWGKAKHLANVSRGAMTIPYCALIYCAVEVRQLALYDSQINLEAMPDGRRNWTVESVSLKAGQGREGAAGGFPLEILTILDAAKRVRVTLKDAARGWDINLFLGAYKTSPNLLDGTQSIDVQAELNGKPLTITGKLNTTGSLNPLIDFNAQVAGLTVELSRASSNSDGIFLLQMRSKSLGDLQESFEIDRALEGEGQLKARLHLSSAAMRVSAFSTEATLRTGEVLRATGSMGDLLTGKNLLARVDADLAPAMDYTSSMQRLDAVRLLRITGVLEGDIGALQLSEFRLMTNLFDQDLKDIGPISAKALKRDPQGRIALEGLKVLAGTADQPYFELDGSIGDLLRLKSMKLSGRIDIPTARVLGIDQLKQAAKLGRLQGAFGVSDVDGTLGIDTLSAKVAGTDLVSLTTELTVGHVRSLDGIKIDVSLGVPSVAAFAKELGLKPTRLGKIAFEGHVLGSNEAATISGDAAIGRNKIAGALTSSLRNGRVFIDGEVRTPHLVTDDLFRFQALMAELNEAAQKADEKKPPTPLEHADEPKPKVVNYVDVNVMVAAKRIEGGRERASGLSGRVQLDDGKLQVGPIQVTFLGGRFNATIRTDLKKDNAPIAITGKVNGWQLGAIFKESLTGIPIRGRLSADYEISGTGNTLAAFGKTANGRVSLRVSNGAIGTSLLDLAGLGVIPWLFSGAAIQGYSKLTCAVAPFAFSNGRATTSATVIETQRVQVVAKGTIDLNRNRINLYAEPRPIGQPLAESAYPFTIRGALLKPSVAVASNSSKRASRAAPPLRPLSALFDTWTSTVQSEGQPKHRRRPCAVQRIPRKRESGQRRR